jgi:hypothetical protein
MSNLVTISGPNLRRINDGPVEVPANPSTSTTTQAAFGTPAGGSTYLECRIAVSDPGDNGHAWGGVESEWAFLTEAPGPGPLQVGIAFGTLSLRAFGSRYNDWGWSSHEVYAGLYAFARSLNSDARDLGSGSEQPLLSFWNVDHDTQNEAKMRRQTPDGSEDFTLNQDRWDKTLLAFPRTLNFRYIPSARIAKGDFVAFSVGFRLMISAPKIDDYDFQLSTESSAAIVWVNLESQA